MLHNFTVRYYDSEEDLPNMMRRKPDRPDPPVYSDEEEIKNKEGRFRMLLRTARRDAKWTDTGTYPVGSVATFGFSDGKPVGWSCGDPKSPRDLRDQLYGLSNWDCFIKYCTNKQYPTVAGGRILTRRRPLSPLRTSSVTPKNLTLNPRPAILTVNPTMVRCPDTFATLTATLKDREGHPIPNATVNFYSDRPCVDAGLIWGSRTPTERETDDGRATVPLPGSS